MEKRLLSKEEKLAIINEVEQSGNITQVIRKQYGFSVKLRMTKKREEWILDQVKDDKECFIPHYPLLLFRTTPFCHSVLDTESIINKIRERTLYWVFHYEPTSFWVIIPCMHVVEGGFIIIQDIITTNNLPIKSFGLHK